jgi:dihydroxyacetone kinase-like predicted kinase
VSDSDLARFRAAVAGGLAHLESRRDEINDLNVFPVADGDTGDNMALTLHAVLAELDALQERYGELSVDEIGRAEIVESVARAALLGARGNSGVILSQLIRGAAEELVSRPGELVDATLVGAALANAADRAYSSVREPAEGTILTVAREMARMIASDVAHAPGSPKLADETPPADQDRAIADTLARGILAGEDAVKRGPELLPALREAGVVDAGGHGLTIVIAGVVSALRGEPPPELAHYAPARITHPEHTSGTYRYCTNFAVTGTDLRAGPFIARLEEIGDSVLVVGDSHTLKVHVHTDEPERAAGLFDGVGEVSHFDVADMRVQVAERDERLRGGASRGGAAAGGRRVGATAAGATASDAMAAGAMASGATASDAMAAGAMASGATASDAMAAGAMASGATASDATAAGAFADGASSNGFAGDGASVNGVAAGGASSNGSAANGARPHPPERAAGGRADGRGGKADGAARARCGVLAVASGSGLAALFAEQGAHVIDGGPTLNPSTYELLAGIHEVDAEEVIVLPSSPNVVMAAERAAELSDKHVEVVKALSLQAGIAAAVALMADRGLSENVEAMEAAIDGLRIGAVAEAARADAQGRFTEGEAVGLIGGEVVAWGQPGATLAAVIGQLGDDAELVSVLTGASAPLSVEQVEELLDGTLAAELEIRDGGQSAWWWLISAE